MPLIRAAVMHRGSALIDVVSPCIAFNHHAGSTRSFDYVREDNDAVNRLDAITGRDPVQVDNPAGTVQPIEQPDGTWLTLRKIDGNYDAHDRLAAISFLRQHAAQGQIVTGLPDIDPDAEDLHAQFNTVDRPLNSLDACDLCAGSTALDKINASVR